MRSVGHVIVPDDKQSRYLARFRMVSFEDVTGKKNRNSLLEEIPEHDEKLRATFAKRHTQVPELKKQDSSLPYDMDHVDVNTLPN